MRISTAFLISGLVCPAIGWLSVMNWLFAPPHKKRSVSFLFIPFIGPILLSCWIVLARHSPHWIPVVWLCDISTIGFLPGLPNRLRDLWKYASFNQIMKLTGDYGDQSVEISLYKGGNYSLQKSWSLANIGPEARGGVGEPGTFKIDGDTIIMSSDLGVIRQLVPNESDQYVVNEDLGERPGLERYSLDGWILSVTEGSTQTD